MAMVVDGHGLSPHGLGGAVLHGWAPQGPVAGAVGHGCAPHGPWLAATVPHGWAPHGPSFAGGVAHVGGHA
jgi:hypothetical protein